MDFIILGWSRSGTTMLVDSINQQKNIMCNGELFHSRNGVFFKTNIWKSPKDLLDAPLNYKYIKAYGLKMLFTQVKNLKNNNNFSLLDYLKEKNLKIIIMTRRNVFLRNLSSEKAFETNCYRITERKLKENPDIIKESNIKIEFDIPRYKRFLKERQETDEMFKNFFNENNINYKEIFYEDVISENKDFFYKDLMLFLGVKEEDYIKVENTKSFKQNIYKLEEQISNFDEVKETLADDIYFQEALSLENNI